MASNRVGVQLASMSGAPNREPPKVVNRSTGSCASGIKPSRAGNRHNCSFNSANKRSQEPSRLRRAEMECANSRTKRVRWVPHLTQSLLYAAWECVPLTRGFPARLEERWNSEHPNTPSTASALTQRLTRLKKKGRLPSQHTGNGPDPEKLR